MTTFEVRQGSDPTQIELSRPCTSKVCNRAVNSPSTSFAAAYKELQQIAEDLKPSPNKIPDVDAIEPLVRRANVLARFCQKRINAVRALIEEQQSGTDLA